VRKFQAALVRLDPKLDSKVETSLGVDLWVFEIEGEQVRIYSDAWSIDIEGPAQVVRQIQTLMAEHSETPD